MESVGQEPPNATFGANMAREFFNSLQKFMQQQATPSILPEPAPRINEFVEQFRCMQPPRFNGKERPTRTEEWITGLELIYKHMSLTEAQKVSCAQFLLAEDAARWLESYKRTLSSEEMQALTWDTFEQVVMERYFPQALRDQKELEFINLPQGTLIVTEYDRRFNQLSRYALHLVDTNERKARRFEKELRPEIGGIVSGLKLPCYAY